MKKIAIFASGNGSNAEHITRYFNQNIAVEVCLILTNNPQAGVLARANNLAVPTFVFNRNEFLHSEKVLEILLEKEIDLLVLAGFLWLVPANLLKVFHNRIINVHPALLPKYGGKGMYGMRVHEAVIESGDERSGITIHYVNEKYDEGQIIFQAKVEVKPTDTAESLASKIHELEYAHFPVVIEEVLGRV